MTLAGKNILVTGAAGFIGSHLSDKLSDMPIGKLVVLDNMYLGKDANLDDTRLKCQNLVEYLDPKYSTANYDVMEEIFAKERIDVVFDLATIPLPASLEDPKWCFEEITAMAVNLAELCRKGAFKTLFTAVLLKSTALLDTPLWMKVIHGMRELLMQLQKVQLTYVLGPMLLHTVLTHLL